MGDEPQNYNVCGKLYSLIIIANTENMQIQSVLFGELASHDGSFALAVDNAGPTHSTLDQHCIHVIKMFCTYWLGSIPRSCIVVVQ